MALPLTKSAMESLGKRLAKQSPPADADIDALQALLLSFDEPLGDAVQLVHARLGLEPTSRIKTTGTILDKLYRHGGSILKSMQDLAGMRLVGDFGRAEQDVIVAKLVDLFTVEGQSDPKVMDRRKLPSSGYRAVHVVVHTSGVPVEIQVRTQLQHEWADLYEKLADKVGRGIRYGGPPDPLPQLSLVDHKGNPLNAKQRETLIELQRSASAFRDAVIKQAQSLAAYLGAYEDLVVASAPVTSSEVLTQHRERISVSLSDLRDRLAEFGQST
jgi:hypothetical protein